MALDPNRWTLKTQEAFNRALELARSNSNPEVTPDHLLLALLGQEEGVVLPILQKVGKAPLSLRNDADEAVGQLPKAYGGESRLVASSQDLLEQADAVRAELHDEYLSTEHLLLTLADQVGVSRDDLLDGPPRGPRAATASPARTPRTSSRRSRSTAATSPRPPARARSTRSSGATTRSAG